MSEYLGCTPAEAQARLTATQFMELTTWLDSETRLNDHTPEQWQSAATAYQVYQLMAVVIRMFTKAKMNDEPKMSDFLVAFKKPPSKEEAKKPVLQESVEEAMAKVRASAFGALLAMAEEAASSPQTPGEGVVPPGPK